MSFDPTAAVAFVAALLLAFTIIGVAARRLRSGRDYYTAGGGISAGRNAFALAGDFISAGGFLGLSGLIAQHGLDAALYAIGVIAAWPLMLLLFAAPLKRLGHYTLADVIVVRLGSERLRVITASIQLIVILLGLTSNLVGALLLLGLLFGLGPVAALATVALVLLAYVLLGGMLAATWLQIVKAGLLLATTVLIVLLTMSRFDFSLPELFRAVVAARGPGVLAPGAMYTSAWDTSSLVLGLALGGASLPHVLMRMNTVPDPVAARRSAFLATGIVVGFHILLVILGLGAMALLAGHSAGLDKGGNLTLPLLAELLGGKLLLGVVAAIAFTTLLAVMTGQCIAGSAALAHDLWPRLTGRTGTDELRGARVASVALLVAALLLAFALRAQNIGYIGAMSLAIAAAANFPVLSLGLFWPRLTAAGAVAGMVTGLLASFLLIALSPLVQVNVLGRASIISLSYPAVISVPLATLAAVVVSLITRSAASGAGRPAIRGSVGLAALAVIVLVGFAVLVVAARPWLARAAVGGSTVYCITLFALAVAVWLVAWADYRSARRRGDDAA